MVCPERDGLAGDDKVFHLSVPAFVFADKFMLLACEMRAAPAAAVSGPITGFMACVLGLINRVQFGKIGE